MSAQDTENQAGGVEFASVESTQIGATVEQSTEINTAEQAQSEEGAAPAPDAPDAPAPAGGEVQEEPQSDEVNPAEALREKGIQFILASRRLGFDPKDALHEILESIKD